MNIFDDLPANWQELQDRVGQLFSELGCTAKVGETIELARGKKEVDVLVDDAVVLPVSRYVVECKHWNAPVPQEVVHSFRTVVADCGAHRGFIVSKAGFQAGAYEAVRKTNIELCTFKELQELFFNRWKEAIAVKYMPYADRLFPFWDPSGGRRVPAHWGPCDIEKLHLLNAAYQPFLDLGPSLAHNGYTLRHLPFKVPILDDTFAIIGELELNSYRQFYDFISATRDVSLARYEALFAERP
ncbi:restriction endonuclease [Hydrogenophaga palleronii]|uniref:restriction endonuclease n=1 Tax=Hydrogenophaga palleronii TaxID=65655 RepID=UPI000824F49D|nr:restriction endonuclease [Hydrogenophaga palleronii]